MKPRQNAAMLGGLLIGLSYSLGCSSAVRPSCLGEALAFRLPPGFCASTFAEGVKFGRHMTVAEDGRVFVVVNRLDENASATSHGSIVSLRDSDGDGRADQRERFGSIYGSEIKWRSPHLYVSSPLRVARFELAPGELASSREPETVVQGFPQAFAMEHTSRPFAFDDVGSLYVHVGAPSNSCQEDNRNPGSPGVMPCPGREQAAGIWRFPGDSVGLRFPSDGSKIASGLRHTLALWWNKEAKVLQFVQQGRDELHELFPQKFSVADGATLPPEELLEVRGESDFGWPYCYYDHIQGKRVLAPEYGGDGRISTNCEKYALPLLTFPAHTSPSDMIYYSGKMFPERYRSGVFISFAGGWGRRPYPQLGYNVAFVTYKAGQPERSWEVFADGFAGGNPVQVPNDAESRPSALAQMPDGSLLVLDGRRGRIWRIIYDDDLAVRSKSAAAN